MNRKNTPEPRRYISTFLLEKPGRVWCVMNQGSPETAPLKDPNTALSNFKRFDRGSMPDDSIPVWDGENGIFTTWKDAQSLRDGETP